MPKTTDITSCSNHSSSSRCSKGLLLSPAVALAPPASPTPTASDHAFKLTKPLIRLINALQDQDLSLEDLMTQQHLRDLKNMRKRYIHPALAAQIIETVPAIQDQPQGQHLYRLTVKSRQILKACEP